LATGCDLRFPIDYGKYLFDVWKDAVLYESDHKIYPPFDTLQFARLLKASLGGHEIASRDNLPSYDDGVPFDLSIEQLPVARTPVLISREVVYLGPIHGESFLMPKGLISGHQA
jgi:hypothetical protein